VLVVDDDERNLLAIRTVVEDVAEVVVASSGEEALRQLLKGEFAVILLDVYMPGMDGYETAQIIRSREQTKRIPIVFLSAVNKEMPSTSSAAIRWARSIMCSSRSSRSCSSPRSRCSSTCSR
jgi:CheY-like chemotaxis protein